MPQAYSDPRRESDPHALPDVEYWFEKGSPVVNADGLGQGEWTGERGWYWHVCFPGCLPDSEPNGPFATEAECIADFTDTSGDDRCHSCDDTATHKDAEGNPVCGDCDESEAEDYFGTCECGFSTSDPEQFDRHVFGGCNAESEAR